MISGEEVRLTPREYQLLRILAGHAGQVVTHRQIILAVWGSETNADAQFVRVLMASSYARSWRATRPVLELCCSPSRESGYRLSCDDEG